MKLQSLLPVEILHQEDLVAGIVRGIFHVEAAIKSRCETSAAVFVPDTKLHERGGFIVSVVRAMFGVGVSGGDLNAL